MPIHILIILAILIILLICGYNRGIMLRNYVREAFATMDVYLKKRWDLVPNLIEIVKKYTKHEKDLLTDITKLRTQSYDSLSQNDKLNANIQLGEKLSSIIAVAENYPDLKANQSYTLLMQQLESVENDIAYSRKYYNGTVRELNTFLDIFPTNLIGMFIGLKREKMFIAADNERQNIEVN